VTSTARRHSADATSSASLASDFLPEQIARPGRGVLRYALLFKGMLTKRMAITRGLSETGPFDDPRRGPTLPRSWRECDARGRGMTSPMGRPGGAEAGRGECVRSSRKELNRCGFAVKRLVVLAARVCFQHSPAMALCVARKGLAGLSGPLVGVPDDSSWVLPFGARFGLRSVAMHATR